MIKNKGNEGFCGSQHEPNRVVKLQWINGAVGRELKPLSRSLMCVCGEGA